MRNSTLPEYDPPRPRLTGAERRAGILCAARSEFARVGYYGASTASIARVAGCSEPMLYKHFAGKLDLFMQALQDAISRARNVYGQFVLTGDSVFDQTVRYLEQVMEDPGYQELIKLRRIAVSVDDPAVRELLLRTERESVERIELAMGVAREQGLPDPGVEADYVAFCWLGMMQAACYRETLEPGSFRASAPHIKAWLRSTWRQDL